MEFSKKKLLSIVEEVNMSDVDEMARRQVGLKQPKKDKEGNIIVPQFVAGWKDDNPTPPGEEGIPDYWIVNVNRIEGEEQLYVPLDCEELEEFYQREKDWLLSLTEKHNLEPQLVKCTRGKHHRPIQAAVAGGYQPSGVRMSASERILRYSNRKKGEGFYDIIRKKFEEGSFADYLSYCSIPPILTDIKNIDRYAVVSNQEISFKTISFDKYESLQNFLKSVIEKIRPIANFNIPENNKPTYDSGDYLQRLFNTVYKNWDAERKSDKKFLGYTDIYKLKRLGYEESDIDVLSSNFFEINGKLLNDGTYIWKITMSVKFGKKLKEDPRIKRLTEDKFVTITKNVEPDPENTREFSDDYTVMDNLRIKQGLLEAIQEFLDKVKEEITPQDALRLGRMTYGSTGENLQEHQISKMIKNVIKSVKK